MPCFQKPTSSTIEKLIAAKTPVTVKWLVKVNACTLGDDTNRDQAQKVREKDEHEQAKDVRHIFAPFLANICLEHVVDEAGKRLNGHLPTSGDKLALHAAKHKAPNKKHGDSHPHSGVGERDIEASDFPSFRAKNRLDLELLHWIDFAFFGCHDLLYP